MKESRYNFFVKKENENDFIAFNTYTCALAEITEEDYKKFKDAKEYNFNKLENTLKNSLKHGGFIIEDDINETNLLKLRQLKKRFHENGLCLTIAPTLKCNFRCTYCYESSQDDNTKMTETVQEDIINYVEELITLNDMKFLSVTWYGGEPLLAMDIIQKLSVAFIALCKEKNIEYEADIVTNGYLLTDRITEELINCDIQRIQVTLDGPAEIHDKRRVLENNKPTFHILLRNIKNFLKYDHNIKLNIRMNVDNINKNYVNELCDTLIQEGILTSPNASLYLGEVYNINNNFDDDCMKHDDFNILDFEFNERYYPDHLVYDLPKPISTSCASETLLTMVIEANGNIHKCWDDIGFDDRALGNISQKDEIKINETYLNFVLGDCFEKQDCIECKFLPVCMGGCTKKRLAGIDACVGLKSLNMDSYLNKVVDRLAQQHSI